MAVLLFSLNRWGNEAQRDKVTCPRLHRKPVAVQGIEPRFQARG